MKRAVLLVGVLSVCAMANAQVIWDEAVQGDLSGDRFNPTSLNLNSGINGVLATSGVTDIEYVHFHMSAGMRLDAIVPISYTGQDGVAFIGVQAGNVFTEPPSGTNVGNLLGWALWGPGVGNMNTNILPAIGTGAGAQGFVPPLTGSDYTFWIQNTGDVMTYRLDFNTSVVPEPISITGLLLGGIALIRNRRRSHSK